MIGVVTPSNSPLFLTLPQVAAGLLAGNGVVWKPAPAGSTAAFHAAALCYRARLPPALLQIVPGDAEAARDLVQAGVDKLFFTGGSEAGRSLYRLQAVARPPGGAGAVGPPCRAGPGRRRRRPGRAGTRLGEARQSRAKLRVGAAGPGGAPTLRGVCRGRARRDDRPSRGGGAGGARAGGARAPPRPHRRGPIGRGARGAGRRERADLVADVASGMRVVEDEVVGPVLPVAPFDSEELALRWINGSPHRLSASIWSNDVDRARDVAARLDVGQVWINDQLHPDRSARGDARGPGSERIRREPWPRRPHGDGAAQGRLRDSGAARPGLTIARLWQASRGCFAAPSAWSSGRASPPAPGARRSCSARCGGWPSCANGARDGADRGDRRWDGGPLGGGSAGRARSSRHAARGASGRRGQGRGSRSGGRARGPRADHPDRPRRLAGPLCLVWPRHGGRGIRRAPRAGSPRHLRRWRAVRPARRSRAHPRRGGRVSSPRRRRTGRGSSISGRGPSGSPPTSIARGDVSSLADLARFALTGGGRLVDVLPFARYPSLARAARCLRPDEAAAPLPWPLRPLPRPGRGARALGRDRHPVSDGERGIWYPLGGSGG